MSTASNSKYRHRIVEYRRVRSNELRVNPLNFRTHPSAQLNALRGSLRSIGIVAPLIAYEDTEGLTLIDGHARLGEGDEWDVAIVDLTKDEAALAIAMIDPIAAMANTDKDALKGLLSSITADDDAVASHLSRLAADNGIVAVSNDDSVDANDNLLEKWQVEAGDVWDVSGHTLVCGDSTDEETVASALRGRVPFLMVTDPPYGVEYDAGWRHELGKCGRATEKLLNDDRADWTPAYILSNASCSYVWHAQGVLQGVVLKSLEEAGYEVRNTVIWVKNHFAIGRGHYHQKHELCFYAVKAGHNSRWCGDRKQSTVWEIDKYQKLELGHPTQKPVECMARPIRNHGNRGDIVYDPFCGSGTTLVACHQEGRVGIGIEMSPKYCAVILERLTAIGLEAKRVTKKN